jgi:hypothetical protein
MNSRVHMILLLAPLLALSVPIGRPAHAQTGKNVRSTAMKWLSYGGDTAIDLNTGDHRWMVPMGDLAQTHPRLQPLSLPPVGRATRGHALLTKTLLIVGEEGNTQRAEGGAVMGAGFVINDPKLFAYDKATGKIVGEVALARNATAAPMTYMPNGKQFIVVATWGSNLPADLSRCACPDTQPSPSL